MMRAATVGLAAGVVIAGLVLWRISGDHASGPELSAGAPVAAAGPDPTTRPSPLDRELGLLKAAEGESPRDQWDPDYVVGMLGRDPERLTDWVRNHTVWIPYRGAL